jgi:hypothetical protein
MSTFNGIGTTFYGAAKKRPDGSYVSTEWLVLAYFPIFPIRSFRMAQVGRDKFFTVIVFTSNKRQYVILEKIPLSKNLRQILLTWMFTLVPLGLLWLHPFVTWLTTKM